MAIFLKLSSFIGFPPLWFGLGASYPKLALRVTDVLAQKLTLRVTYVLAHQGNRCAGTWHLLIKVGGRGQRVKATSFASNSKPQTLNPVLYTTLEKDFQQKK